jgi:hypothetical protein
MNAFDRLADFRQRDVFGNRERVLGVALIASPWLCRSRRSRRGHRSICKLPPSRQRATTVETSAIPHSPITHRKPISMSWRRRILAARLPEKEPVTDHSQGVPLVTVQKLAKYWATEYDWRKVEAKLNALPQFITEIDGLDIHFIHVVEASRTRCR